MDRDWTGTGFLSSYCPTTHTTPAPKFPPRSKRQRPPPPPLPPSSQRLRTGQGRDGGGDLGRRIIPQSLLIFVPPPQQQQQRRRLHLCQNLDERDSHTPSVPFFFLQCDTWTRQSQTHRKFICTAGASSSVRPQDLACWSLLPPPI